MVVKKDGRIEQFDKRKVIRGIKRAGAGRLAKKIADEIAGRLAGREQVNSSEIRELVIRGLQSQDEGKATHFAEYRKAVRKLVRREEFLENRLVELVGSSGSVRAVYGGFQITVEKPDEFDFAGVFRELLKANQSISVELRENKIVIAAK